MPKFISSGPIGEASFGKKSVCATVRSMADVRMSTQRNCECFLAELARPVVIPNVSSEVLDVAKEFCPECGMPYQLLDAVQKDPATTCSVPQGLRSEISPEQNQRLCAAFGSNWESFVADGCGAPRPSDLRVDNSMRSLWRNGNSDQPVHAGEYVVKVLAAVQAKFNYSEDALDTLMPGVRRSLLRTVSISRHSLCNSKDREVSLKLEAMFAEASASSEMGKQAELAFELITLLTERLTNTTPQATGGYESAKKSFLRYDLFQPLVPSTARFVAVTSHRSPYEIYISTRDAHRLSAWRPLAKDKLAQEAARLSTNLRWKPGSDEKAHCSSPQWHYLKKYEPNREGVWEAFLPVLDGEVISLIRYPVIEPQAYYIARIRSDVCPGTVAISVNAFAPCHNGDFDGDAVNIFRLSLHMQIANFLFCMPFSLMRLDKGKPGVELWHSEIAALFMCLLDTDAQPKPWRPAGDQTSLRTQLFEHLLPSSMQHFRPWLDERIGTNPKSVMALVAEVLWDRPDVAMEALFCRTLPFLRSVLAEAPLSMSYQSLCALKGSASAGSELTQDFPSLARAALVREARARGTADFPRDALKVFRHTPESLLKEASELVLNTHASKEQTKYSASSLKRVCATYLDGIATDARGFVVSAGGIVLSRAPLLFYPDMPNLRDLASRAVLDFPHALSPCDAELYADELLRWLDKFLGKSGTSLWSRAELEEAFRLCRSEHAAARFQHDLARRASDAAARSIGSDLLRMQALSRLGADIQKQLDMNKTTGSNSRGSKFGSIVGQLSSSQPAFRVGFPPGFVPKRVTVALEAIAKIRSQKSDATHVVFVPDIHRFHLCFGANANLKEALVNLGCTYDPGDDEWKAPRTLLKAGLLGDCCWPSQRWPVSTDVLRLFHREISTMHTSNKPPLPFLSEHAVFHDIDSCILVLGRVVSRTMFEKRHPKMHERLILRAAMLAAPADWNHQSKLRRCIHSDNERKLLLRNAECTAPVDGKKLFTTVFPMHGPEIEPTAGRMINTLFSDGRTAVAIGNRRRLDRSTVWRGRTTLLGKHVLWPRCGDVVDEGGTVFEWPALDDLPRQQLGPPSLSLHELATIRARSASLVANPTTVSLAGCSVPAEQPGVSVGRFEHLPLDGFFPPFTFDCDIATGRTRPPPSLGTTVTGTIRRLDDTRIEVDLRFVDPKLRQKVLYALHAAAKHAAVIYKARVDELHFSLENEQDYLPLTLKYAIEAKLRFTNVQTEFGSSFPFRVTRGANTNFVVITVGEVLAGDDSPIARGCTVHPPPDAPLWCACTPRTASMYRVAHMTNPENAPHGRLTLEVDAEANPLRRFFTPHETLARWTLYTTGILPAGAILEGLRERLRIGSVSGGLEGVEGFQMRV